MDSAPIPGSGRQRVSARMETVTDPVTIHTTLDAAKLLHPPLFGR